MENKLYIILIVILLLTVIAIIWNNISLEKLRKKIEQGTNTLPDDRYFELKYKIQYITFAFTSIIIIAGIIGWSSLEQIKSDISVDMNKYTEQHSKKIDNLIDAKLKYLEELNSTYDKAITNYDTLNLIFDKYIKNIESLDEQVWYDNIHIVKELLIETTNSKATIYFKDIGYQDFKEAPVIFIQTKNNSKIKLLNVSKKSFEIAIEEKKEKNIAISLMIFI